MSIFVTGAAGFIGFSLCKKLLDHENQIIGIDNLNPYYEVKLKKARITNLQQKAKNLNKQFIFIKKNIENKIKIGKKSKTSIYDIPYYITDNGNVFKTYKWKPKKSMYDVVKDTYIWLSTNKKTIKKYF